MRRLQILFTLAGISLIFGIESEEIPRISADASTNPANAKKASDDLAQRAVKDAELIGGYKKKLEELSGFCASGTFTPEECQFGEQMVHTEMDATRVAVVHHKTLSLIFHFYHTLMTMNIDPRKEVIARSFSESICYRFMGLPSPQSFDILAFMDEQIKKYGRLPEFKHRFKPASVYCQEELKKMLNFLAGKEENSELSKLFVPKNQLPVEEAKKMLDALRAYYKEQERESLYQKHVRNGAA